MKSPFTAHRYSLLGLAIFLVLAKTICLAADTTTTNSTAPVPTDTGIASPIKKQKFNLGPWENETGYAQAIRVGNTLYL